jgi:radical SAM superfamily enzyme YgiQ (UPF0313 family)
MAYLTATVDTPQGRIDLPTDLLTFSAARCFAWGERTGRASQLYRALAQELLSLEGPIALYGVGPFLEALLCAAPELARKASGVVDPMSSLTSYAGLPVYRQWRELPGGTRHLFLCELRSEPRWRLRRTLEPAFTVLCPDLLAKHCDLVPQEAWLVQQPSIYPMEIPALEIEPGLDLLLLDLPARNNFALPLSLGYVHRELQRIPELKFRTLDADAILYHRYHIWRLFDFGEPVLLDNGRQLLSDPWEWTEEAWMDPRLWGALRGHFARDIEELVQMILQGAPRVLALTVHQRNEWLGRLVARRVKEARPETLILAGGHSCVSPTLGPKAFPEFDYMVIGEAESVLQPLILELKQGHRPGDLPGVLSRFDSPGRVFTPSEPRQDLDLIGAPSYDFAPSFSLFQSWRGGLLPYLNLTRGCIWARCSFCAERFPFRTRSARSFVDELEGYCRLGLSNFNFSESDFGGRPEVLAEVADEILRRGLKVQLNGQLRVNPRHDLPFVQKLTAAGIVCNYGIDGMTAHTLKLQRKGYSIETVRQTLKNCSDAGVRVVVNLVVGVPGETEQDVEETVAFIVEHREFIAEVFNISPFYLMHASVYWQEPERHAIRFLGDQKELYERYPHGIPDRYWYSEGPYIDGAVRRRRGHRVMTALRQAGMTVSEFAETSVMYPMFQGFQNLRDLISEVPTLVLDQGEARTLPLQLGNQLQNRIVVELSGRRLAFREQDVPVLQRACGSISIHG